MLWIGALLGVPCVSAEAVWPELNVVEVPGVGVVSRPIAVRAPHDGTGRMFIVEQGGRILVLDEGEVSTFLDISSRVRSPSSGGGNEQGLLGLAFPPDYGSKGYFYVDYTRRLPANDGATVLSRFHLTPTVPPTGRNNVADPESEEVLLTVSQPFDNHNGGDLHFGPDGYLYLGLGDGGSGGDPGNRAQNPLNLLGKMLRLDVESPVTEPSTYNVPRDNPFVDDPSVFPEIWGLGLRNPWRWSFDRETGDLYIGDVGQDAFEEINFEPAGMGGRNYQWRRYEAFSLFSASTVLTVGESTPPILATRRADGDRSITGGYVYRGSRFPRMRGVYVFADYVSGRAYAAQREDGEWAMRSYPGIVSSVSSFGEDEEGNLYMTNLSNGRIYEVRDTQDAGHLQIVEFTRDPGNGRVSFTFGAALGRAYQVLVSEDLTEWIELGAPLTEPADGDYRLAFDEPTDPAAGVQARFFRVREE
jgi:glucose/arabinose dehydrogenase